MAIRKTKDGKYQVDVYAYEGGVRKRYRFSFKTLALAKDFVADATKAKKDKSATNLLRNPTRSIVEMAEYYYTLPRFKQLKPRSQLRNVQLIGHLLSWCAGNGINYIHEFTGEVAQKYISHIMDISSGKGRQHNFIAAKMLFAEELKRDTPSITKNPFRESSPFRGNTFKPISLPEELINLLRDLMTDFEKQVFDIMYYTGCRNGELLYLTWDQVTNDKVKYGTHSIFDKKSNKWIEWTTKTANERTVPLNRKARECFFELRMLNVEHNYVLPDECRNDVHWLLRTFDKIKRRAVKMHPELNDVLFSKDKKKSITPKRLRSSFITHIIRNTGNIEIAKVLAGHTDVKTTLTHYSDHDALDLSGGVDSLNLDK